ncbi:MAG: transcriptional coactivator hfi1/ADA1 [Alyxoria varia]|nr:MAG: transcriptional coactivator hfi1/ADA1 [Alyxoria varia]
MPPDINPAALDSRTDQATSIAATVGSGSAGPSQPPRPPPLSTQAQKSVPRVDLEPLYSALRSAIGDQWATYKDATSRFVLGCLSIQEFNRQTSHIFAIDPPRIEHLHNQLTIALHANALRDQPDAKVATWVSEDKPAAGAAAKPTTGGDAAEQRLKTEVMNLPPRARLRIKSIKDDPPQPLTTAFQASALLKRLPTSTSTTQQPSTASGGSAAASSSTSAQPAGGANATPTTAAAAAPTQQTPTTPTTSAGLNKDADLRKRYNLPLLSESRDIPPAHALHDRILPITYEEGLTGIGSATVGAGTGGSVAELMADATGVFVKECLTAMLSRTRTNAPVSDAGGAFARETAAAVKAAESAAHSGGRAAKRMKMSRFGSSVATSNGTNTANKTPTPEKNSNSKKRKSTDENTPTPTALPASTTTPWPLLNPTNPIPSIATRKYKTQLHSQSIAAAKNTLKRNEAGLLPCEVESLRREKDGRGRKGDLRLAWELGEHWMGSLGPWLGERLVSGVPLGEWDGGEDEEEEEEDVDELDDSDVLITGAATAAAAANGVNGARMSGAVNGHGHTPGKDHPANLNINAKQPPPRPPSQLPNGITKPNTPLPGGMRPPNAPGQPQSQQQQAGKQNQQPPQPLQPQQPNGNKRKRPPSLDNTKTTSTSNNDPSSASGRPAKRVSLPNGDSAPASASAQNIQPPPPPTPSHMLNGHAGGQEDPSAWGWHGAGEGDRSELEGLLDACLTAG